MFNIGWIKHQKLMVHAVREVMPRQLLGQDWMPLCLSILARGHAQLDHFDDAWRCIDEAIAAVVD